MKTNISITSVGAVSALGSAELEVWEHYKEERHFLRKHDFAGTEAFGAFLPERLRLEIEQLREENPNFKKVDDSVLFGVYASRKAVQKAVWEKGEEIGINIGSSRGATSLFENYHRDFLQNGKANTLTSPNTTLGNISSWVAQDLQSNGVEISHSVTCSTALHAVLNGVAWINSGMTQKFLAGGSEAALTPFTISQVQAMKISAREDMDYPCQALNLQKKQNSMVLGEGAAVICMEAGERENALALISGVGYATERLKHSVSISANGSAFQQSMKMAMGDLSPAEVDAIVMHAPGTIKGDLSEMKAIKAVFGKELPALTTNKWKIGHTFGASGTLSLELAILMLQQGEFISVPFSSESKAPKKLRNILVNAVGFGGNAVTILVSLPKQTREKAF
ncbi:3-oxoacyl-(acyl-carrier-protein) synthase [Salinimicrobium catena]|uniref:3-oxoacyl-(Acyl-carrier-protein) synthase n=1 Tax=Salinimicrobium catena TaxID=390640 RepID=A0A1H5JGP6_9FLAO|nr:beta-ketoacyl synthase N-terminal-like domain-containing protein [Salinimicrobium catena]SDK87004.1 3-oxoacyl-(acyl-carrier-protein) synthase [Salinimicrobium catena]SEE50838.1 3-oxoacyl-(acyl-carrier-protein) synthase [Salinimicrobium catena]